MNIAQQGLFNLGFAAQGNIIDSKRIPELSKRYGKLATDAGLSPAEIMKWVYAGSEVYKNMLNLSNSIH